MRATAAPASSSATVNCALLRRSRTVSSALRGIERQDDDLAARLLAGRRGRHLAENMRALVQDGFFAVRRDCRQIASARS